MEDVPVNRTRPWWSCNSWSSRQRGGKTQRTGCGRVLLGAVIHSVGGVTLSAVEGNTEKSATREIQTRGRERLQRYTRAEGRSFVNSWRLQRRTTQGGRSPDPGSGFFAGRLLSLQDQVAKQRVPGGLGGRPLFPKKGINFWKKNAMRKKFR